MSGVNRYLCFGLGKEEFAIPLLRVKEVLGYPEVTPIPQAPELLFGHYEPAWSGDFDHGSAHEDRL